NVALCHACRPGLATGNAFTRVLAELLLVERVDGVLGRDDLVGVDVVAELPGPSANNLGKSHLPLPLGERAGERGLIICPHRGTGRRVRLDHLISAGIFASTSLGWLMTPVTALAAATAGFER